MKVSTQRGMRGDAGASQAFRNDARAQKNPASGGANRPLGVVAALARCSSIAPRAAPSRGDDLPHQIDSYLPRTALTWVNRTWPRTTKSWDYGPGDGSHDDTGRPFADLGPCACRVRLGRVHPAIDLRPGSSPMHEPGLRAGIRKLRHLPLAADGNPHPGRGAEIGQHLHAQGEPAPGRDPGGRQVLGAIRPLSY